jgi:NAD(P)H-flavin reductase
VRWNKDYIMPVLKEIENGTFNDRKAGETKIKKIYVCGPPIMNETFDRDLFVKMDQAKNKTSTQEIGGVYPV